MILIVRNCVHKFGPDSRGALTFEDNHIHLGATYNKYSPPVPNHSCASSSVFMPLFMH